MKKLLFVFAMMMVVVCGGFAAANDPDDANDNRSIQTEGYDGSNRADINRADDYEGNKRAVTYDNKNREEGYERIERAVAEEQWERADSLIVEMIVSEPENPNNVLLLSNLGMIRFYNGNDSLAVATLSRAHEIAPQSVTVLANRARVFTAMGDAVSAISDYNTIVAIDSTYSDAFLNRGMIFLYAGAFEAAEADFNKLNQLAPNREDTHVALALLYSITSRPREAMDYYSRLIAANPQPEYYAGRAMCLLEIDDLIDAADDISLGLELDPNYSELYLARAILNQKRYERQSARSDAIHAIELGANVNRVVAILGNILD